MPPYASESIALWIAAESSSSAEVAGCRLKGAGGRGGWGWGCCAAGLCQPPPRAERATSTLELGAIGSALAPHHSG